MKFSVISALCLVGSAIAAPALEKREDTVAKYHITRILQSVDSLDKNIRKEPRYSDARATDDFFRSILQQQRRLTDDLRDGATEIRKVREKINDFEATGIATRVMPLEGQIRSITNQMIKFKREAERARVKDQILRNLIRDQQEGNNFWDALIDKLTLLSGSFAKNNKNRYNTILDRAVREYR
jgi:hypothetical protein